MKQDVHQIILNALNTLPKNTVIIVATDTEKRIVDKILATKTAHHNTIIQTGAGISNALDVLLPLRRTTPVLNFGFVGSNKFKPSSIFTVKEVRHYHPHVTFDRPEPKFLLTTLPDIDQAICYTCQDFAHGTTIEEPVIFDMELAIIARLYSGQPIISIKIVSDNMVLEEYENFLQSHYS